MDQKEVKSLLSRYLGGGQLSDEEKARIESWYLQHSIPDQKNDEVINRNLIADQQESLSNLLTGIKPVAKIRSWPGYAAVAAILLITAGLSYQFTRPPQKLVDHSHAKTEVASSLLLPGHNKVVITLSNGKHVELDDDGKKHKIANENGTIVDQGEKGSLSYKGKNSDTALYNVATTPRGGQYELILADGTKVWLNAATTLKYPVNFSGDTRRVVLNGEAYFEVAHDPAHPFIVVSGNQSVRVLGTHFNINAYDDEKVMATTLLQGSISLSYSGKTTMVSPGEQARFDGNNMAVLAVNTNDAIAWKRGYFLFKDADIRAVMRQFSRWYDVDIEFQGNVQNRQFSGGVSRQVKGSELLDLLAFKNIHYTLKGKTIIITP